MRIGLAITCLDVISADLNNSPIFGVSGSGPQPQTTKENDLQSFARTLAKIIPNFESFVVACGD